MLGDHSKNLEESKTGGQGKEWKIEEKRKIRPKVDWANQFTQSMKKDRRKVKAGTDRLTIPNQNGTWFNGDIQKMQEKKHCLEVLPMRLEKDLRLRKKSGETERFSDRIAKKVTQGVELVGVFKRGQRAQAGTGGAQIRKHGALGIRLGEKKIVSSIPQKEAEKPKG